MPSFDIVCELDAHEVTNAVDQANREVSTRFDFRGADAKFEYARKDDITLKAETDFQLQQMRDMLMKKLAKRSVDLKHLNPQDPVIQHKSATQVIKLKQGIEKEMAKKIVKLIKAEKYKVQASIQGEQVRVTGKKRDDLQEVIGFLQAKELELPLQFDNFRD
ncbi:MAG: YajQ family cyclic di-GMP-binding protein [Gammaproteobacteria bacterium]|nr:YajQ family cyclic di-GMP-binding protein [Gammaproteobacteria bacterium]